MKQPTFQPICTADEIAIGDSQMFVVGQIAIAVFNVKGEFFALRNECPHAGASLAHGKLEGDVIRCRIHHWGFCVRDGTYVDEEKPTFDAKTIPLRLRDGMIEVAV